MNERIARSYFILLAQQSIQGRTIPAREEFRCAVIVFQMVSVHFLESCTRDCYSLLDDDSALHVNMPQCVSKIEIVLFSYARSSLRY